MSDNITNKILDSFENIEDLKEYSSSQYKTIISQSKKITELERKVEGLESKLFESEKKAIVNSALAIDPEGASDTETACLIQIAMIKGLAMNRELTLEETKKLEIFAKTLLLIRGKEVSVEEKRKEQGSKLTLEQLMQLSNSLNDPEQ